MANTTKNKSDRQLNRLYRHIVRCPWDKCARKALGEYPHKFTLPALTESPSEARAEKGVTLTALKRAA